MFDRKPRGTALLLNPRKRLKWWTAKNYQKWRLTRFIYFNIYCSFKRIVHSKIKYCNLLILMFLVVLGKEEQEKAKASCKREKILYICWWQGTIWRYVLINMNPKIFYKTMYFASDRIEIEYNTMLYCHCSKKYNEIV